MTSEIKKVDLSMEKMEENVKILINDIVNKLEELKLLNFSLFHPDRKPPMNVSSMPGFQQSDFLSGGIFMSKSSIPAEKAPNYLKQLQEVVGSLFEVFIRPSSESGKVRVYLKIDRGLEPIGNIFSEQLFLKRSQIEIDSSINGIVNKLEELKLLNFSLFHPYGKPPMDVSNMPGFQKSDFFSGGIFMSERSIPEKEASNYLQELEKVSGSLFKIFIRPSSESGKVKIYLKIDRGLEPICDIFSKQLFLKEEKTQVSTTIKHVSENLSISTSPTLMTSLSPPTQPRTDRKTAIKILVINGHGSKKKNKIHIDNDCALITPGDAEDNYILSFDHEKRHLEEVTYHGKVWPIQAGSEKLNWRHYQNTQVPDVNITPLQTEDPDHLSNLSSLLLENKTGWEDLTSPKHNVLERGVLVIKVKDNLQVLEKNELANYLKMLASKKDVPGNPIFFCDKELGKVKPLTNTSLEEIYKGIKLIKEFQDTKTAVLLAACSPHGTDPRKITVMTTNPSIPITNFFQDSAKEIKVAKKSPKHPLLIYLSDVLGIKVKKSENYQTGSGKSPSP